jgi:hypothetical protein
MVRDPRADKDLVVAVIIAVLTVSQPWKDTQAQQNTLPPWAEFGISVAAAADTIFVAAVPMRNGTREAATVVVFQRRQSSWVRTGVLPVPEVRVEELFGASMAADGDTLVVGAQFADRKGDDSGLAYVFERSGEQWHPAAVLSASDAGAGDQFGLTVSVSGGTIAVGARLADSGGRDAGATYVFARRGGTWQQIDKLMASDARAGDLFGRVSVDRDTMLVTADLNDDRGPNAGKAYAIENRNGAWVEVATILASDGNEGDEFGVSVALANETAVFGAAGSKARGADSGAAYLFERHDGRWAQITRLTADDGAPGQMFGFAVAAGRDTIVAGAPNHRGNGERAGAAYIFERRGDGWRQTAKLVPSDAAPGMWFGNTVAISGDRIVVGMLLNGQVKHTGAAYVFERREGNWVEAARLLPDVAPR